MRPESLEKEKAELLRGRKVIVARDVEVERERARATSLATT